MERERGRERFLLHAWPFGRANILLHLEFFFFNLLPAAEHASETAPPPKPLNIITGNLWQIRLSPSSGREQYLTSENSANIVTVMLNRINIRFVLSVCVSLCVCLSVLFLFCFLSDPL